MEETLRSVLLQDYPNLEYIVIDDGSSDNSVDIIEKYAEQVTHWESRPNEGQACALERGFNKATGEILGWVNSDDFLLPGCLFTVASVFKSHPAVTLLAGGWAMVDEEGYVLECIWPVTPNTQWLLEAGCFVGQPACFWTKNAFDLAGGFDTSFRFSMDYDLWLRLLQHGRAKSVTRPLACFRMHDASKSATDEWQRVRAVEDSRLCERFGHQNLPRWRRNLLWRTFLAAMAVRRRSQWIRMWRHLGEARPWLNNHQLRGEILLRGAPGLDGDQENC